MPGRFYFVLALLTVLMQVLKVTAQEATIENNTTDITNSTTDITNSTTDRPKIYHWPIEDGHPTVLYMLSDDHSCEETMKKAMTIWEKDTCIKFRPANTTEDASYLRFISGEGEQHVHVGKQFEDKPQDVPLYSCMWLKTLVPIIGSSLGLIDEQNRPDREDFLEIHYDNIMEGKSDDFKKIDEENILDGNIEYDFTSAMQPSRIISSVNGNSTITPLDMNFVGLMGRTRRRPSFRDIKRVNNIHGCTDIWLNNCETNNTCENGGYTGPDCTCVCPPGTNGTYCETTTGSYYSDLLPTCNQEITEEMIFSTPNYPEFIPEDTWCVYKIKGPTNATVGVRFIDVHLKPQIYEGPYRCTSAFLEIMESKKSTGQILCHNDIVANQTFNSTENEIVLYLDVKNSDSRGFQAEVTFFPLPLSNETEPEPSHTSGNQIIYANWFLSGILLVLIHLGLI